MDIKRLSKHLFLYIGIILAIISIVIIVLMFTNGDRKYNYEQVEEKLKDAAIEYYKDNSQLLPNTDGGRVSVSAYDLEKNNYITKLQDMVKGDSTCSGEVRVVKNGDNYLYSSYLNCGNDYTTTKLYEKITAEDNIVTSGDGVYKLNNEYVYKGEAVNNYVKFADKLWRIIKVDENNDIKIILDEKGESTNWDDRYNIDKGYNSGINDYKISRIRDYLNSLYNDDEFLSDINRSNIVNKDICIGKRNEDVKTNDGSIECSEKMENQPIAMLQVNEFLNASIDPNCNETTSNSCQNYNYLANYDKDWWSITADASNSYKAYEFTSSGIDLASTSSFNYVKPVIYISSVINYDKGNGTLDNPYLIK